MKINEMNRRMKGEGDNVAGARQVGTEGWQ